MAFSMTASTSATVSATVSTTTSTDSPLILSGLFQYPLKSARGRALDTADVGPRGLAGDRRWMLVDDSGKFLSQREHGVMALIDIQPLGDERWQLQAPGQPVLQLQRPESACRPVRVWSDDTEGQPADAAANAWFSTVLGQPVTAVYMPERVTRAVDARYAQAGDTVSYADGFPLLLIGESSLADLNARLRRPVSMRNFRPNLVVRGAPAFAEDDWQHIRIGDCLFDVVKPCSRCVLTTRDPDSGDADPDREPLRTLASYRRREGGVMFGQNLIPRSTGQLMPGMRVQVLR